MFSDVLFVTLNVTFTLLMPFLFYLFLYFYFRPPFINPLLIVYLYFAPVFLFKELFGPYYLFVDGFFDYWYSYSLFLSNVERAVYYFFTVMGVILLARLNSLKKWPDNSRFIVSKATLLVLGVFFFLAAIGFLFFIANKTIGLSSWLSDPRFGYQFHRAGNGHLYAGSIYFLMLSLVFFFFARLSLVCFLLIAVSHIVVSYFYGAKMIILSFFVMVSIMLWYYRLRFYIPVMFVVGVAAFSFMLLNYGAAELGAVLRYFDYHVNSAMFYEYQHNTGLMFEGDIWLTDFWSYVPRFLFEDKPYVYGDILIREIFWPGAAEATHTPGMAGPVGYHGDFGFVGVLLSLLNPLPAFLYALSLIVIMRSFRTTGAMLKKHSIPYLMFFCFVLFPNFFMYVPVFMQIFILICTVLVMLVCEMVLKMLRLSYD